MSIPARYSGVCRECGEVACSDCFLIHPEGTCNR